MIERREQRAAGATRGIVVVVLQCQHVAAECGDARVQPDRRQPRGLRLADAVECRGDPPLGRDDVGPSLEHVERHAHRDGARHVGQARRHLEFRRRVAADEDLSERTACVCASSACRAASFIVPKPGPRERDVPVAAVADALSVLGQRNERARGRSHRLRRLELQLGLDCGEPAAGHLRRQRLARKFIVGLRRGVAVIRRIAPVAEAAPEVRFPGHAEHRALQRGREVRAAARLDSAGAQQVDPGQQRGSARSAA